MSKKLIQTSAKLLRENGGYFVSWSRAIYDNDREHRFVRLDKVFMNVIYQDENGRARFRRIQATRQVIDNVPLQVYTMETTYRITTGRRRGCVVTAKEIEGSESFHPAGIHRYLEYGPTADRFHENHQSDIAAFKLLRELPNYEERSSLLSFLPSIYLTYNNSGKRELSLRPRGESLRWLQAGLPVGMGDRRPNVLLSYYHRDLAETAGRGRLAMPYAHVYGRGVLAAGSNPSFSFGSWVRVQDITVKLPHMEICHELADIRRHDRIPR